jgi:hypothetical protein
MDHSDEPPADALDRVDIPAGSVSILAIVAVGPPWSGSRRAATLRGARTHAMVAGRGAQRKGVPRPWRPTSHDIVAAMPCLAVLLAIISPRLALVVMALFSNVLSRAFDGVLLPLLGFFLLPWTTLAYAVMWDVGTHEVTGFEWFVVVAAFLLDIGAIGGTARGRR